MKKYNSIMMTSHIIISGGVQGIGFRKWIKRQAKQLSLVGWVKNRADGAVESIVQGDTARVEQLISLVHSGPPLASVSSVVASQIVTDSKYDDFIVIQ